MGDVIARLTDDDRRPDSRSQPAEPDPTRLEALAEALADSDEVILHATTEEAVYSGLCDVIVRHGRLPLAWVGLAEPGKHGLRVQASAGTMTGYLEEAGFAENGVTTVGGIIARALRTGQAQAIADLASEPGDSPARALAREHGIRSTASFPIRTGHMVVGTLQCSSDKPGYFDDHIMALFGRIVAAASTMLVVLEHEHRRREVEQNLTHSERRRQGLFDLSPVPILVIGSEGLEANGAILEMLRYKDAAALEAAGPLSIIATGQVESIAALRASIDGGESGPNILQTKGRRADGSTFPMLVERIRLDHEGTPSVVLFLTDLTPLEAAEAGSRQSKARLATLVDNAPVAFITLDLDGIISSWNPAAERIFGRTEAQVLGRPGPRGLVRADSVRRIITGQEPHMQSQLVGHKRSDGANLDLRISTATLAGRPGEPDQLLVVAEDVTHLGKAETERARLAAAIEQSSESIVITDGDAKIEYVNPAFERLTGYSREEAIGKNPRILQSGTQDRAFYDAMWAILLRGETWHGTFVNQARDGRIFEEDAAISPVLDSAGLLINYVAVKRDVTRERQAEAALRQSELRFRNVFDIANDAIFIRDLNGKILEVNKTACARLGYTRDQLLGMTIADINRPENSALLPQRTEAILKQGSACFETTHVRRDGTPFTVEVNSTVIEAGGRKAILSVARDISERLAATETLRESEEKFAKVFRDAPVWIVITDLETSVLLDINDGAARASGFLREESIGHTAVEIGWISADDRSELVRLLEQDGRIVDLEMSFHAKDGRILKGLLQGEQVVIGGRPCLLTVTVDITELKQIEAERISLGEELAERTAFAESIIASAGEGIVVFDTEMRYRVYNPVMESLTGVPAAEIIGRKPADLFPSLMTSGLGEAFRKALAGETVAAAEIEFSGRRSDRKLWIKGTYHPHLDAHGEIVGVVVSVHDNTAQHEADAALLESQGQFRTVFDSAGDGMVIHDPGGRFIEVNQVACERVGYSREEVLTMNIRDLLTAEAAVGNTEHIAAIMKGGAHTFQVTSVGRDGSEVPTEVVSRMIEFRGRPAILSVLRDITERKRAEEELRLSEARFRAIVDELPVAIGVSHGSVTVEGNDAYRRLFGLKPEDEIAGHPLLEQIAPECRSEIQAFAQKRDQNVLAPQEYETVGLRTDGSRFPMHVATTRVGLTDGPATLAILTDLSDQRRAEKEREESREQLRAVVDSTDDLIWSVEPVAYRMLTLNEALRTYFAADVGVHVNLGDRPGDLLPPETAAVWTQFYERALRDGPFSVDYVSFNGERTFQLSFNILRRGDSVFGISVFGRDVTEKREADEALRRSEERFRTLFENAGEAILITDEEGHFLNANRAACDRLGYSKEELMAMTASQIDTPRYAAGFRDRVARLLRDGVVTFEAEHLARDGNVIPSEVTASIIELDGKRALISMARDLTEQKKSEAERAVLEEQLRQAQKMEEIGRLAGGIAHDFNNLLTAIRGNASLALASLPKDEGPREDLQQIEEAADRAAALTRQLLAFARRTILQPEVVELGGIVRRVEPMLRRLIGEDMELVTITDGEAGSVLADPGQIEQVIVNLVINARDAMPEGGRITIRTARGVKSSDGQAEVALSVADTGVGMSDETMGHLFEPFFTTKSLGKGTGLGLATVYGIVRQSGGTVAVESQPSAGSTFTIRLPLVESTPVASTVPQAASALGKTRSGTILVVEDDDPVRRFTCRVLEAAGYTVLGADGGEAALELAGRSEIDLLLTDVVMPGMRGKEVAARIGSTQPAVKFLYMSGHSDASIVNAGVLEAGIAFLAKPFTSEALLVAVETALAPAATE